MTWVRSGITIPWWTILSKQCSHTRILGVIKWLRNKHAIRCYGRLKIGYDVISPY
jgi:hypothetical protein